jgi:hypothetical protein
VNVENIDEMDTSMLEDNEQLGGKVSFDEWDLIFILFNASWPTPKHTLFITGYHPQLDKEKNRERR